MKALYQWSSAQIVSKQAYIMVTFSFKLVIFRKIQRFEMAFFAKKLTWA